MLISLPVHNSTPGIASFADDIKRKGSLQDHSIRIFSTREDGDLAFQIADSLSDHFRSVTTQTLPPAKRNGIKLANDMFLAAFKWQFNYKPAEGEIKDPPMLYLDPTYRPVANNWVDQLQAEFYLRDAPAVMARVMVDGGVSDKQVKTTLGPVILGSKFLRDCTLVDFLDDREHWRTRMWRELVRDCHNTLQIGHGSKSLLKPTKKVTN